MNREDIIRMAQECQLIGMRPHLDGIYQESIEHFAALVADAKDAEHKEAMRWDIHSCGPTCKRYACVATREAVAAEREACAKVCEVADKSTHPADLADAIRARGQV